MPVEHDDRHFQRYLEVIQRWISPRELERLLRLIGTPEQAEETLKAIKARKKQWDWNTQGLGRVKEGLVWFGLVGGAAGAILAIRAAYAFVQGSFAP